MNPAYQYEDKASQETPYVKDSSPTSTAYSEINDGMVRNFLCTCVNTKFYYCVSSLFI